jgi:hypothetical protein
LAEAYTLLISKEAHIVVANLILDYIVQILKALYLWLLRQVAARSYQLLKDPKINFQCLENSPVTSKVNK